VPRRSGRSDSATLTTWRALADKAEDGGKQRRLDIDFHFDAPRLALLPASLSNAYDLRRNFAVPHHG
jgi:hypothetical protein